MAANSCVSLSFLRYEWVHRSRAFWLLTGLLVATRMGPLPWVAAMAPVGDEGAYINSGAALLTLISQWLHGEPLDAAAVGRFYHFGWHPPLPAIVAGFPYALGGIEASRALQALIGVCGGLYFFRLAHLVLPRSAALVAYGAYALNPYLIAFSHFLWSENVYVLLTTIWLIWYLGLFQSEDRNRSGWLSGGLLTGLLWLAKSAFTAAWLGLLVVVPLFARPRRVALRVYVLAGLLGLALTIPWDLMIYSQESRFIHGSTATAVHVATKYNNLNLSKWIDTWRYTHERAAGNDTHFTEEAKQISADYFRRVGVNPLPPLKIVARDTLYRYLLGASFIDRHLSWGVYPTAMPALGLGLLLYDRAVRFLVIGFGVAGLLLGGSSRSHRWTLVMFALGNAAIVLIGVPNGRHIVMNYPALTLGAAALWRSSQPVVWRRRAISLTAMFLIAVAIADFAQYSRRPWPHRFLKPLLASGVQPIHASDVIAFRPGADCRHQDLLLSTDAVLWGLTRTRDQDDFRQPASVNVRVGRPWLRLKYQPPLAAARRYLDFADADGRRFRIDLDTVHNRWRPLEGSCLSVRWLGDRPR